MAPTVLLGPPEIKISPLPTAATTTTTATTTAATNTSDDDDESSSSASSNSSSSDYSSSSATNNKPLMGYTENNSRTFLTTTNPCLDFFFHVVPDSPVSDVSRLVSLSWAHNSLTTLKLICNLRGVRGTGKSAKEGFYTAALWLHNHHPKTLSLNIRPVSGFGYLKDLPEILYRLLEGSNARKKVPITPAWAGRRRGIMPAKKEETVDKEKARALRLQRKNERARRVLERYNKDSNFRLLYDCVSDVFADLLKKDVGFLNWGDFCKIGLAAKWCPTLDSTYDEVTLLCESIARRVFPKDDYEEYKGVEEAHYAYKVRDRLRKEVLVPLRKALELPEVYMSANKWDALPYNRVPSVAMKLYKKLYYEHDCERFEGYLEKVKSGKASIAAGALLPHEIIASLKEDGGPEVAELQWRRMVDDLGKKGKLSNCMAICDVSGSMCGTPLEVSVALGLLISELSEDPWKGKLITFSGNPQFHITKGETLREKTEYIKRMDWEMNTDFQKVFDRILEVAVQGKITEDQMIKTLFVFSDMEFDQANSSKTWETDYMAIQRKFREKGFERVPEIVFWNLRNSQATPVPSTQPGVALVSGFSKNLVTLFLEEGGILHPEAVMLAAISKPEYDELVVHD